MDLRGHGLSDAPTGGHDPAGFAADVVAVAEGSGICWTTGSPRRPGGPRLWGDRCRAGLRSSSGIAAPAWSWSMAAGNRSRQRVAWRSRSSCAVTDEPPEVMRSMAAFLADRAGFDPASWDADQERAARSTVVETHAGKVVPATRPMHAKGVSGRCSGMTRWPPFRRSGADRRADRRCRRRDLRGRGRSTVPPPARVAAGRDPIAMTSPSRMAIT